MIKKKYRRVILRDNEYKTNTLSFSLLINPIPEKLKKRHTIYYYLNNLPDMFPLVLNPIKEYTDGGYKTDKNKKR